MVDEDGFIRIDITSEMIERARAKASEMGSLNNSIRNGAGNLVGFLGEEVARAGLTFVGHLTEEHNTYEHDLMIGDGRLEVKTKDRTVDPRLDYDASVANYNTRQDADVYVFVSILREKATGRYLRGHVVGLMDKPEYFQRAKFLKAGEIDPSNGWVVSADCHNLPYHALYRFA